MPASPKGGAVRQAVPGPTRPYKGAPLQLRCSLNRPPPALLALQAGELEQRDRMCWQLVHQLAALDTSNEAAVQQLMAAVVKEQAGCVQE